jgi:hypothetical protein
MPTDDDDTLLPFALPSIGKKKVTAAFDSGQISSDGGVLLLAGADKRIGLIDTLAALIPDHRDPALITHTLSDILRARVFAIACGYPDADDLASQPTMSRWENAPDDAMATGAGQRRILHYPATTAEDALRIKETASRIREAFAANCPRAALFRGLAGTLILRPA